MFAFHKTVRNGQHVRRYSIRSIETGWEVHAQQDSHSIRHVRYDDWHRVERARRSMLEGIEALRLDGWVEEELASV